MVTMILLLKRRPGMTHEEFRHYYESGHAMMAKKYFGHLFMDYRRHYVNRTRGSRDPDESGVLKTREQETYDAITKIDFKHQADLDEFDRIASLPEVSADLRQDEAKFLDRDAMRVSICEEVRTWTAKDAGEARSGA